MSHVQRALTSQQSLLGNRQISRPAEQDDDIPRLEAMIGFRDRRARTTTTHACHFDKALEIEIREGAADRSGAIGEQYRVQARFHTLPSYAVRAVEGPEHRPMFTVEVSAEGGVSGVGVGASKQAAEQEAARQALDSWNQAE